MGLTCIRNRVNTGMGRTFAMALALFCLALPSAPAFALDRGALPTGGAITSGSGSISAKGSQMTVNQTSQKMIANWDSFNIGADAGVTFNQPNATAAALNRISGKNPSQIMGRLSANGQVFLINPAGILFGSSAKVNVGGLVASSLDIGDEDFLKGNYTFNAAGSPGTITNAGTITADGGYVALLSPVINNTGTVTADQGTVAMAAADKVSLDLTGDGLITYTIDQGAVDAQVANQGLIRADGGLVFMSAEAAHDLTCAAVNNTGIVRARTLGEKQGRILLMGDMDTGRVLVNGTLDASAPYSGDGGFIETSAKTVTVADDTTVSTLAPNGETGTWLIDPTDFTIESGSGSQTTSSIGATTLSNSLGSSNVSITTSSSGGEQGDINVNAEVSWSAARTLTLSAHDDININADITAASGNLTLNYGQSSSTGTGGEYTFNNGATINLSAGNHFTTKKGYSGTVTNWTVITDLGAEGSVTGTDLQGIKGDLTGNYVLGADINASNTSDWWDSSYQGFTPLGDESYRFEGSFDGLGHIITGLTIRRNNSDQAASYIGLFGCTNRAQIGNVGLINVSIIGNNMVGGLAGHANYATTITNSYVTGTVQSVSDGSHVGGLLGSLSDSTVTNSYSTAAVSGTNGYVGGLIGTSWDSTISNSYATGSASSPYSSRVGGLAGAAYGTTISNCYATGTIAANNQAGGLLGFCQSTSVSNSFWNTNVISAGVGFYYYPAFTNFTGLTSSEMKSYNSFSSYWDISDSGGSSAVWRIYEGSTYPLLRNFLTSTTVTAGSASRTYDGATTTNVSHSIESGADASLILGGTLVANTDKDVGTYTGATTYTGLYSTQQGYDISYVNGTVEITPATLTVNAGDNKVYDGTTTASISGDNFTGYISGDDVSLAGTFADKNVGSGKAVSYGNSLSGTDAGNYVLDVASGATTADITAKTLTVGGSVAADDKEYDGNTTANISGNTISGQISGDTVSLSQSGSFADKNVGGGKTVTYTNSLGGTDAGNYALNVAGGSTTAEITAKTLTVGGTAAAADKVYDGTTTASVSGNTVTGQIFGDTVTFSQSAAFADKNAGTGKAVTIANSISGADAGNYVLDIASDSATADITPATLTVTGTTAADKVYDGTTDAGMSAGLSGKVVGDTVVLSQSGSFADKNVGAGITVAYTSSISGIDAGNYTLNAGTGMTTADITPASLTITGATASNKIYDGTAAAAITGGTITSGIIGGDDVSLSSTGSFNDKNVGTGKNVTFGLAGADAGNYQASATTTADISAKTLTVGGTVTAADKVYDGTTTASISGNTVTGQISGDTVIFSQSAAFSDKNAGTGKAVTIANSISGADAGNYLLDVASDSATADITPAILSVTGTTAADKVYDGTVASSLSGGTLSGLVSGETVTLSQTGVFADKNTGSNKIVTYANSISGAAAGNYILNAGTGTTTADITPASLTITGATASNKIYDGTAAAAITGGSISSGIIGGDDVTLSSTGSFNDKNIGTGKTVTFGLAGADAGNYQASATTTADISAKTLTVAGTATAADKVYDGTTTASISGNTVTGQISGDTVTFSQSAAFADKNVGTGKTVTIANSISGTDAGNYVLDVVSDSATADINPKTLSVTGTTAADKVYDGTTDATLSGGSLSGLVSGEFLSLSQTSAFADKNAGTDKTVTYTNSISGAAAVNYALDAATGTTTADITPASLTVTGAGAKDKTYDGTVAAVITGGAVGSGVIGNDDVTLSSTGSFSDKNAGTGKTVFFGLAGADAGNYQATTTTTADIIPAALVVTANDDEKVQDGTAYTGGNGVVYDGFVWGEDENALDGSLLYGGSSQGAVVEGSYIIIPAGLSSDNYTITFINGTLAITDQRPVNSGGVSETQKNDTRTRPDISEKAGNTTASPGKANTLIELTNVTMQNNSPMTLASNTGLTSVRFQHRGETHTLFTGNEETVESQANINALSIFSRTTNGSVDALGSYTVKQGMTTISLTKSGETAVSNLDTGNLDPSDTAQFSFDTTDGIVEMTAGITQSGVLVISGVDDTSGLMTEQTILIGLQAVKQDLGVSIGSLNAVIINNK